MGRLAIICVVLLAAAVAGGFVALLAAPSTKAAYRFQVNMYPPTGNDGQYGHLHCKYHGACGMSPGHGLDWDNWSDRNDRRVRWRSYIYNNTGLSLEFTISPNYQDSYACDYFKAWLYDPGLGYGPGDMVYVHATTSRAGTTYYPANGWSAAYYIGDMSADSDCGPGWWSGYHIHEKDVDGYQWNATKYAGGSNGDYCSPTHDPDTDDCDRVYNKSSSYWTRRFQW